MRPHGGAAPAAGLRIVHRAICRHRVEVEVRPAAAELYFRDERWIDPVDTQIRFEAVLYNADTGATWQVLAPGGGPGAGTIDPAGLYQAPDKGALASGTTDIVVATARADPLRKACALVTLVGHGPLPQPAPAIEVWPKTRSLYYATGADNSYIDDSNKLQVFRAFPRNATGGGVTWRVDGTVQPGNEAFYLYTAPASGATAEHSVSAEIQGMPAIIDRAKVIVRNYLWPGL
ncbi:MAG: hypothetical protein ACREFV_02095 [Acetobacteraceae bacterium]